MTSHGVFNSPTTGAHKDTELRVPAKLITNAYRDGIVNELEHLVRMKATGSRVNAKAFFHVHKVKPKTGQRLIKRLIALRWIGYDGQYIFCRSWSRIGYAKKKMGLYLTRLKKLPELLFTWALKAVTRREVRARKCGGALPKDLPVVYYVTALNISERTYHRRMRDAIKCRLVKVTKNYTKIGRAEELNALRRNLHDVPLYRAGKGTFVAEPSTIKFLI